MMITNSQNAMNYLDEMLYRYRGPVVLEKID